MLSLRMRTICYTISVVVFCVDDSIQIQYQGTTFSSCLKQDKPSLLSCAGQQALESLQKLNDKSNFSLADGLTFVRDDEMLGRSSSVNFIDQDPTDIRSILENAGAVMGERTLLWDMSILHPGLQMKVGPSLSGGLLEFVLDPSNQYDDRSHNHYEEFTGRIMARKFVLPFLLGLKFNLATLLPLILGAVVLISKKAAFLSKLALFISGFFSISPFLGGGGFGGGLGGFGGGYGGGYGGVYKAEPYVHHEHLGSYKVIEGLQHPRDDERDNFYDYDKKYLIKDRSSRVHEREAPHDDKQTKFQRNFVWAPSVAKHNN